MRTRNGKLRYGMNSREVYKLKNLLYERQEHRCLYCDRRFHFNKLTIDHIIPAVNNVKNYALACDWCNGSKGDYYLGYFENTTINEWTEDFLTRIIWLQLYLQKEML